MLHVYDPFSGQHGSMETVHQMNQEIIFYAESRFRHILLQIVAANEEKRKWMQRALKAELVCAEVL